MFFNHLLQYDYTTKQGSLMCNREILCTKDDYGIVGFFVWDTSFDLLFLLQVVFHVKVGETP